MKYEGMSTVQGDVRPSREGAVYIQRRRYEAEDGPDGFFNKLYRQFLATMVALILLFSLNLVPVTRGMVEDVREAVSTDYTEDVLAVFGES